ncbi:MAG: MFS transporter, partial [Gemmataceae bacterium]|nr:MFS transporter [Gemmataceae bacterium]
LLYLVTLICFLAIPYSVILPVLVREFFAADPRINGLFYSSSGLGALTAGLYLAAGSLSTGQLLGLARWPMLAAVALVVLSSIPAIALALPTVFALGFSVVMLLTSCNMRLQAMVEDRFRARMMSLYAMLFLGVTPLGSLLTGYLVETWGLTVALRILAGGLLVGIMPFLLLQATTNGAAVEGPTDPRANAGAESVG